MPPRHVHALALVYHATFNFSALVYTGRGDDDDFVYLALMRGSVRAKIPLLARKLSLLFCLSKGSEREEMRDRSCIAETSIVLSRQINIRHDCCGEVDLQS